ncbi:MAG: family 16 glycosylhydrolase [Bacteroidales bacterium]|nr:family 16 glycosylhydrolase [Bacteroidales bacterium]
MKQKAETIIGNVVCRLTPAMLIALLLLSIISCKKNDEPDFKADFSFEPLSENLIRFTNKSTGEYYWMVWNFGNGVIDTITDKNIHPETFYSLAGSYDVTLQLTNFSGTSRSVTKKISIAKDELMVDFTAIVDPANPNYVLLKNTTLGQYNSFEWRYRGLEFQNQTEHTAYFPYAGNFNISLVIFLNNIEFSTTKSVTIASDDPNYDPNLIWAEEFNYTGLPDPAKWNSEIGGTGWGNNELQYYTDRENNAYVGDGVLTITAREEQFGGRNYTSARLTTQGKFDVKYGRIEARIKLPYGQGIWPAFWMLGANFNQVGWPTCGEIDIMEMVGGANRENTCHATIHWNNNGQHANYGLSHTLPSGIFADNFHIFGIRWNSQGIRAYVGDIEYFTADISPAGFNAFKNNFFMILNIAVGGNWPGSPDETTVFPQTMQVDWIRVYQE